MRKLKIIKISYAYLDSIINVLLYALCACLCIYTSLYPSINPSYFLDALQSKLQASLYVLHPKYYAYHYLGRLEYLWTNHMDSVISGPKLYSGQLLFINS